MTDNKKNIIVLALPRWDGEYASTSYSLSVAVSNSERVFYIDNPYTIKDFFSSLKSKQTKRRLSALLFGRNVYIKPEDTPDNFIVAIPRLVFPINWLPRGKFYDFMSRINDRIIYSTVKRIIKDHQLSEYIYVNSYNPHYGLYFPQSFKPRLSIYHCVDDISHSPYVNKHGTEYERRYMRQSDGVVVTSKHLQKLKDPHSNKTFFVPNAANIKLFSSSFVKTPERPVELKEINGDIICYTGNMDPRIDFNLLSKVAAAYPKSTLLLVGPFNCDPDMLKELRATENVLFTGGKSLDELPSYLYHSNCAIIPFKKNKLTESIYPLKINEYLAAGKPVISTNFSVDINEFSNQCSVVDNDDQFIEAIEKEISSNSAEKELMRSKNVLSNNWENRAQMFLAVLEDLLETNK